MSEIDNDKNIEKFMQIRLLFFLFTIPHKVVFKDFVYFLGIANLKNISLLLSTISTACAIPCLRLFVTNLIFIDVVLGRGLEENSCSKSS